MDGKTLTTADVGYYLADTDDSSTPVAEATLWSLPSTDLRQFTEVQLPLTGEVNYLTSYDGHLWSAENGDLAWADLGVIQGADGIDGISVTLDPATVIFEQSESNRDVFTPTPSSFTATVNVWQGATLLAPNTYRVGLVSTTHCSATLSSNQITSLTLGQDSQSAYYSSGDVTLGVWLNPASTSQNPDVTLKFNWAANALKDWKLSVEDGVMQAISSQQCAYYDENGDIAYANFSTVFGQSPTNIFVALTGLKGMTGIDVTNGKIDLFADVVSFRKSKANAQSGDPAMVWINGTTGTLHAVDGEFEGKVTAKNYLVEYADLITYCYDADGMTSYFIPGDEDYQTMYDADSSNPNRHSIDVSNTWYFLVTEKVIILPNYINMIGQRVTIYNPTIGGTTGQRTTYIIAGSDNNGGDIIRGVGLTRNTGKYEPVPIDSYDPVREIEFCDGLIELQCVPSATQGHPYEWCVVNLGTNVVNLRENISL